MEDVLLPMYLALILKISVVNKNKALFYFRCLTLNVALLQVHTHLMTEDICFIGNIEYNDNISLQL